MSPAKTKKMLVSDEEAIIVTKEGLKALKEELEHLKNVRRKEVASRLKEAISYGDLSENSEYEEAKNEQAFVEGRILELEDKIKRAKVVDTKKHSTKVVEVGTKVTIQHTKRKTDQMTITIVGATEADPFNDRVSNESPMGRALMGAKAGDTVTVETPKSKEDYKVEKLA